MIHRFPKRCPWLSVGLALVAGPLAADDIAVSKSAERTAIRLPVFESQEIDDGVAIGYGLGIGDVDGDRDPDILLVDKTEIVWYRNPDWKRFVMCAGVTERDNVCIAARDIDGDGKVEVAIGAAWNPGDTVDSGSVHYLVAPEDPTGRWEVIDLPREPTVHRMRWHRTPDGTFRLVVAPLHGRGNRRGQGAGVRVLSYDMPADPRDEWKTELVDDHLHFLHNLELVDWDGDPEHEVLLTGREGVFLHDRKGGAWERRQLAGNESGETEFEGASEIRTGILPDGGKRFLATIEPFHGNKIVAYTPPGAGRNLWRRRVVDDNLAQGHAVACADLTASGSDQLIVGWRNENRDGHVGVNVYIPLDGEGTAWKRVPVDVDGMACEDIKVHDLDRDGRPDLIAAGRATKNLKIYWNRGVRR